MARYYGKIGYTETIEQIDPITNKSNGIWDEAVIERNYYGEIIQNSQGFKSSGQVNDNITINVKISIIADPYANMNSNHIRYAEFMGVKWKVVSIIPQYPRLILTLGDEYNG